MISFSFIDVKELKLKKNSVKSNVKKLFCLEGFDVKDIAFVFCSDEYLLNVNKQYLEHDFYTDIITFDYCEGKSVSGDIFVSIDRVLENANVNSVSFVNELSRVIYHGSLHLCGYKDKTLNNKKEMTAKEDFYLDCFKDNFIM